MGLLTPCFVPRRGFLYTVSVPERRVFAPFKSCAGGMVLDEINTCITQRKEKTEVIRTSSYLVKIIGTNLETVKDGGFIFYQLSRLWVILTWLPF